MSSLAKLGENNTVVGAKVIRVDRLRTRRPEFIGYRSYGGLVVINEFYELESGQAGNIECILTDEDGDVVNFSDICKHLKIVVTANVQATNTNFTFGIQFIDSNGDIINAIDSYTTLNDENDDPGTEDRIIFAPGSTDTSVLHSVLNFQINTTDNESNIAIGQFRTGVNRPNANQSTTAGFEKDSGYVVCFVAPGQTIQGINIIVTDTDHNGISIDLKAIAE